MSWAWSTVRGPLGGPGTRSCLYKNNIIPFLFLKDVFSGHYFLSHHIEIMMLFSSDSCFFLKIYFIYFLAPPRCLWDLISSTRN